MPLQLKDYSFVISHDILKIAWSSTIMFCMIIWPMAPSRSWAVVNRFTGWLPSVIINVERSPNDCSSLTCNEWKWYVIMYSLTWSALMETHHTHTHTRTHIYTHMCMHTHEEHTHACTCLWVHTHIHAQIDRQIERHACMHTHALTHTHTQYIPVS